MLKEYKLQSIIGIWGGLLFFGFGYLLTLSGGQGNVVFGKLIIAGGYALFILGCFMYVKGKGQNSYLGILGVFGPVGLLLLYCLKDRSKLVLKERKKNLS